MSAPIKTTNIDAAAALLAVGAARLVRAVPPESPTTLVVFELDADEGEPRATLAAFAAGELTGSLLAYSEHLRRLRREVRRAKDAAGFR